MAANTEELAILVRMKDFASKEFQRLRGTIGKFGTFVGGTFKGITRTIFSVKSAIAGVAAYMGAQALGGVIAYAGEIQGIERAFTNLTKSADGATETLKALRSGTKGTVDDFNLMKLANQAMLLGVAKTSAEFEELTTLARRLGAAVGRTTTEAFGDLATGIGRQSKLILDNLGIIVKVEKANEEYARTLGKTTSEMTDAEKKQAFLNATLKAAREKVAELGADTETLSGVWQKLKAELSNVAQVILKTLTPTFTEVLKRLTEFVDTNRGEILFFFADVVSVTGKLAGSLIQVAAALDDVVTSIQAITKSPTSFSAAIMNLPSEIAEGLGLIDIERKKVDDSMLSGSEKRQKVYAAILKTIDTQTEEAYQRIRQRALDAANEAGKFQVVGPPMPKDLEEHLKAIERIKAEREELLAQFDQYMDERIKKEEDLAWKEVQWAITNSAARSKAREEYAAIYTIVGGLSVEFAKMADESRQYGAMAARGMRGAADAITYGLVDALGAVIDRTKTAKEAFSDMARSILSDMARIAQQELIGGLVKGLFSAVGGALGVAGGAASSGNILGAGIDSGPSLDLSSFAGAPRFQLGGRIPRTGLYALHAGEEVVPQPRTRYAEGLAIAPSVNVTVNLAGMTPLGERDIVLRQAQLIGQVVAEQVNRSLATRNRMRGHA